MTDQATDLSGQTEPGQNDAPVEHNPIGPLPPLHLINSGRNPIRVPTINEDIGTSTPPVAHATPAALNGTTVNPVVNVFPEQILTELEQLRRQQEQQRAEIRELYESNDNLELENEALRSMVN